MDVEEALRSYEVWMPQEILECGYGRVYEIELEEADVFMECGIAVPQWVREFHRKPRQAWDERIQSPSLFSKVGDVLSGRLLEFVPKSIVFSGEQFHCRCTPRRNAKSFGILFGEIRTLADVLVALPEGMRDRFRDVCELSAFFSGFREWYPPPGGHWLDLTGEQSVFTDEYVNGNFGDFELTERWNPSVKVFGAGNGDALVFNQLNEWGWWPGGSPKAIVPSGGSLNDFVEVYDRYLTRLASSSSRVIGFDSFF